MFVLFVLKKMRILLLTILIICDRLVQFVKLWDNMSYDNLRGKGYEQVSR